MGRVPQFDVASLKGAKKHHIRLTLVPEAIANNENFTIDWLREILKQKNETFY
jgi:hypothetical protein